MPGDPGGTIGERLASRRRQCFVGRRAELELFRDALATDGDCHLFHVSGPGGIGKSTLLTEFAAAAGDSGAGVVRLDGRDLPAAPAGVLDALTGTLSVPAGDAPITLSSGRRLVLLIDGYEQLDGLDGWFRERLLPRLPGSTVVVLAGRAAARPGWRSDPPMTWSATCSTPTCAGATRSPTAGCSGWCRSGRSHWSATPPDGTGSARSRT